MAIITPFQSQAGIAVGNARGPDYLNANAYVNPMGAALQTVAQGAGKLAEVYAEADLQKRQMQQATDMLADQVAETDAHRAFWADYQQNHKGADAREAVQAANEYFNSRMAGLQQRWGNDPHSWLVVQKMMAPIREQGLSHAQAYSTQEEEQYQHGTVNAKLAQLLADAADPSVSDTDAERGFADYALSVKMLAGGRNMDAQIIGARQHVREARWKAETDKLLSMPFDQALQVIHGGQGKPAANNLPAELSDKVVAVAQKYNVDPALALYVVSTESGGDSGAVSVKGARGLMQLMPKTAKDLGVDPNDPDQNLDGGMRYLKQNLDKYGGDTQKALAAYNWGPGNVDSYLKTGKGTEGQDMPLETRKYVGGWQSGAPSGSGLKWGNAQQRIALARHIEAMGSRQMALEEREMRRQREAAGKDLYTLSFDGKLTREAVEAQRDVLSAEEYNKFLKLVRGESNLPDKSDPGAIIHLTDMATRGDADLQDTANELLRSGKLTVGDYRAAINEGQQFRDPVVKQVMQDIKDLTGASGINPPEGARESYVNARRDYLDWLASDAGKKASDRDRLDFGRNLANRYRIISAENTLLTMPLPLNLVGTKTAPDIKGTAAKIEEQHSAGLISDAQRDEELMRLKRMADIIAQRDRQKAAEAAAKEVKR